MKILAPFHLRNVGFDYTSSSICLNYPCHFQWDLKALFWFWGVTGVITHTFIYLYCNPMTMESEFNKVLNWKKGRVAKNNGNCNSFYLLLRLWCNIAYDKWNYSQEENTNKCELARGTPTSNKRYLDKSNAKKRMTNKIICKKKTRRSLN